ncbi:MAG: HD domain-containing protein [Deltaproteobacteria bacterium]|nr:HD domain-containing protein [Deltaproteobacteria bacterium]
MKTQFVADIQERETVESSFLVREKVTALAKNGKPYMTVRLMDRSGEVEGRIWDRVEELEESFRKDDFLWVRGKASRYLGKMQLVVQELKTLSEHEVNLEDYLPTAPRERDEMAREFAAAVDRVSDPHYRALLEAVMADAELFRRFCLAPAAKSMHHVYVGGLLEHSLAVAELAAEISRRYSDLDRDLLVTSALLHDLGKTAELSFRRSFDYTDDGKLLGHIMIGVEMVSDKIRGIAGFPAEKALILKHLLLSHHGQYEFGSPKRPKTLEAVILNMLDDLDAKISAVKLHLENDANGDGAWTGYHRLLERYFFKGFGTAAEVRQQAAEQVPKPAPQPEPERAKSPAPVVAAGKKPPAPPSRELRVTLAEQLKGKNLDLFGFRGKEE